MFPSPSENVQLEVKGEPGTLYMLLRTLYGEELRHANVFMLTGTFPAETTAGKMLTAFAGAEAKMAALLTPEQDTGVVHATAKKGDLYVLANRVAKPETACAMPLPNDLDDPDLMTTLKKPGNYDKIGVRCVPVGPTDMIVVLSVPPWPRFD